MWRSHLSWGAAHRGCVPGVGAQTGNSGQALPRRRRVAVTASVLLLPFALAGCSDDSSTAPPPAVTPAATPSGARCATAPLPSDGGTDPAGTSVYTVDGEKVAAPHLKGFSARTADRSAVLVSGGGELSTRDSGVRKSGGTTSLTASGDRALS